MNTALIQFFTEGIFASAQSMTIVDDNAASFIIANCTTNQRKNEPRCFKHQPIPSPTSQKKSRYQQSSSLSLRKPRPQRSLSSSSIRRVPRKKRQPRTPTAGCRWGDTKNSVSAAQEATNAMMIHNRPPMRRSISLDSSTSVPRKPVRRPSVPRKPVRRPGSLFF